MAWLIPVEDFSAGIWRSCVFVILGIWVSLSLVFSVNGGSAGNWVGVEGMYVERPTVASDVGRWEGK